MLTYAFTVHTVRPDDIGAVEIVFLNEQEARDYARDRSSDFRVLATSVTRFTIGQLGTRWPLAWFVNGTEQPARDPRPGLPGRRTPGSRMSRGCQGREYVPAPWPTSLVSC